MWIEVGNFETVDRGFEKTKSIQYRYDDKKHPSKITAVLLDAGRDFETKKDFFKIELMCSDEEVCETLGVKLKAENLEFGSFEGEVFFKSDQVSELMRFMTVAETIEPKVLGRKEKIKARCAEGFPPNGEAVESSSAVYTPAADLTKEKKLEADGMVGTTATPIADSEPKAARRWCSIS